MSKATTDHNSSEPKPMYDAVFIVGREHKDPITQANAVQRLKAYAESKRLNVKIIDASTRDLTADELLNEIKSLNGRIGKETQIEIWAHGGIATTGKHKKHSHHVINFHSEYDIKTTDLISTIGEQTTEPVTISISSCYSGFVASKKEKCIRALPVGSAIIAHSPDDKYSSKSQNYEGIYHRLVKNADAKAKQQSIYHPVQDYSEAVVYDPTTKNMVIRTSAKSSVNTSTHMMSHPVISPQANALYIQQKLDELQSNPSLRKAHEVTLQFGEAGAISSFNKTIDAAKEAINTVAAIHYTVCRINLENMELTHWYQDETKTKKTQDMHLRIENFRFLPTDIQFRMVNIPSYLTESNHQRTLQDSLKQTPLAEFLQHYSMEALCTTQSTQTRPVAVEKISSDVDVAQSTETTTVSTSTKTSRLISELADTLKPSTYDTQARMKPHISGEMIVDELIAASAKDPTLLNLADADQKTLLHHAAEQGNLSIVKKLTRQGVSVNTVDKEKATPLITACENGHPEIVQILIDAGSDIHVKGIGGKTPLAFACENGHVGAAKILIAKGAQTDTADIYGKTLLHLAIESKNPEMMQFLINTGLNVNQADKQGLTPLHYATLHKLPEMVDILLHNGANVNLQEKDGSTPLHIACYTGDKSSIRMLVKAGANVEIEDNRHKKPVDIALNNRQEIEATIQAALIEKTQIARSQIPKIDLSQLKPNQDTALSSSQSFRKRIEKERLEKGNTGEIKK